MVKRLLSANASELIEMTGKELKQSIKASAGRVVLSENIVTETPMVPDISNAELARAFGADLILLNGFDAFNPKVKNIGEGAHVIETLRYLVGRPVGVNLEPVDKRANMTEAHLDIALGRQASSETVRALEQLGVNFICMTGNPATGVTNDKIIEAIESTSAHFSGLIIAGKMHSSGVDEPVITKTYVEKFIEAGADMILVPAVGTVPGFDETQLKDIVKVVHRNGGLVMSAVGTSQESADPSTIRDFAIRNKICGVDIQHIGDGSSCGLAPVENIFELSKALRGERHTLSMIARSINR
ncbi:PEP phosphonomutase [Staphylococcus nepalensis]|uniref:PEP phosphonomutase n=1 Tax=Staphylococcus nepalensis TaxID=214473 RepID=A0A2T4S953_9STAP|nr:PEP phosphonomutase [Staphylococcus nepalensis]PTK58328.1 PEP phosphonomutase [Staphylococcus nepalensis]